MFSLHIFERAQISCYELKEDLSYLMLRDSLKISKLQGFVWKTI